MSSIDRSQNVGSSVVKNIDISISIDTEISERYQYKFSEVSILRS